LSGISKNGAPIYALAICGISIPFVVVISTGNLQELASVFNLGTLLTFAFINLSLLKLRKTLPNVERGFRVPFYPITPVIGIISCVILASFLSPKAFIYGSIWIIFGLIIYYLTKRKQEKGKYI